MKDGTSDPNCPHCKDARLCSMEGEVCCAGCGAVLGSDYQAEQARAESKLNLYQAVGIGTRKVNLECAKRIHEASSEVSLLSNVCVKLDLPIYAAREANSIYQKVTRQRYKARLYYAKKLTGLARLAKKGNAGKEELEAARRARPSGCTRAHTAVFAIHLVCRKYGLPRTDRQILEAVRMNYGIKRAFTVLKAYSLNEFEARKLGIECTYDKSLYYIRLVLSKVQGDLGSGPLYERIMRLAASNMKNISDPREDARASRAVGLAMRGAKLNVQI